MYLSFGEYRALGGTLDGAAFDRLEFRAESAIDEATFGRLKSFTPVPYAVKMLVLELVNINEKASKDVTSMSNDGYSESYAQVNSDERSLVLINSYLSQIKTADGTPVLYRGVRA